MHILMIQSFLTKTTNKENGMEVDMICPIFKNSLIFFSISSFNFFGYMYGVIMMGLAPSYNSMVCSKPLSGGLPIGISPIIWSCFLVSGWMFSWWCWLLYQGFYVVIRDFATQDTSPCLNMLSIYLVVKTLRAPLDMPLRTMLLPFVAMNSISMV